MSRARAPVLHSIPRLAGDGVMGAWISRRGALAWLAAAVAVVALPCGRSGGANPLVPLNYSAPEMVWPVTVDGKLDDWRGVEALLLLGKSRWQGAHPQATYGGMCDLAGRFRLGWDRNNLYLAVEVYDDDLVPPRDGAGMTDGDCVVVAVDAHNNASQGYDEDDSELGFAYTPAGPLAWRWFPVARAGALPAAKVGVVREEKPDALKSGLPPIKLTYEIAIPWSELQAAARAPASGGDEGPAPRAWGAGDVVGFDIALNDADAAVRSGEAPASAGFEAQPRQAKEPSLRSTSGGSRRGWLQWTPGIMGIKDPSQFGNVVLAGPAVTE